LNHTSFVGQAATFSKHLKMINIEATKKEKVLLSENEVRDQKAILLKHSQSSKILPSVTVCVAVLCNTLKICIVIALYLLF